jgi:hypothetical protein
MIGHGHGPTGKQCDFLKNIVCKVTTKNIQNINTIKAPHFLSIFLGAQMNESLTCPCCLCQNPGNLLQDVFENCVKKEYKIHFNNIGFQTKGFLLVENLSSMICFMQLNVSYATKKVTIFSCMQYM